MVITLGAITPILAAGGLLNSPDAQAIDKKIDDGLADNGKVYSTNGHDSPATCTTGGYNDASSNYIISNNDKTCIMAFWIGQ